jgi:hypothetical protein
MTAILQQFNTLGNIYLSYVINTGDKLMDNTIIGIGVVLISCITNYIITNWREIYNKSVFYIYKMYENPILLHKAPYIIERYINKDFDAIFNTYSHHYIDIELNNNTYKYIYNLLINNNLEQPLRNKETYVILYDKKYQIQHVNDTSNIYRYVLYTICIDYNGKPVYMFINSGNIYFLFKDVEAKFIDKVKNSFINYINEEEEKMNPKDTSTKKLSKILVPFFTNNGNSVEYKSLGTINDKKTFDTLFYTDKAELMGLVNRFKTKTMYPSHIPMDNKLGILLYGPPGTGKTGTISAIANMLERDIVLINFTEITTKKELDKILDFNQYNNNIYVFDEIDFILDVIDKVVPTENKIDYQSLLLVSEGDERKQILEMAKSNRGLKSDKIDMVYLLQKLDGIESGENRCIIATTNNPQKLNSALIRPGRFDIKLCLSHCTSQMCKDILSNYYNHKKDNDNVEKKLETFDFPENKYSPLQLMNMAMSHKSLDLLLDKIYSENIKYEVL